MALGVHAVTGAKGRGMGLRVGELAHLRDAVELRRTVGRLAAREVDVPLVIKTRAWLSQADPLWQFCPF